MVKISILLIISLILLVSANGMVPPEQSPEDRFISEEVQEEDIPDIPSKYVYIETPLNTAVEIGQQAIIYCQSNSSQLSWFFFPHGQTNYEMLIFNCQVNADFEDRIRADYSPDGHCNLVVLKASARDAGTYSCFQTDEYQHAVGAVLTVITSPPNCTSNATTGDLFEFEYVEHYCSVGYVDNLSEMLIKWIDAGHEPVDATEDVNQPGFTSSKIVVQACPPALSVYLCVTYFKPPGHLQSTANNTPVFNYSCSSTASPVKLQLMVPEDTIQSAGSFVNMTCRRRSQSISWTFIQKDQTYSLAIVGGDCRIGNAYIGIYDVDNTLDACHLIIDPLASHHQGTYTCQDVFAVPTETFSATLSIG